MEDPDTGTPRPLNFEESLIGNLGASVRVWGDEEDGGVGRVDMTERGGVRGRGVSFEMNVMRKEEQAIEEVVVDDGSHTILRYPPTVAVV